MKFCNCAIDAQRQAEVVRIDDEAASHERFIADGREIMVGSEGL